MKNPEYLLKRLISLESHIAHQDIIIQDLNEVVLRHWKNIDLLKIEISLLKDQIDILSVTNDVSSSPDNSPPHY